MCDAWFKPTLGKALIQVLFLQFGLKVLLCPFLKKGDLATR